MATDIVTANIMGFEQDEIPTFSWAVKAGMKPAKLNEIEVRGEKLDSVRRKFVKPRVRINLFMKQVLAIYLLSYPLFLGEIEK